MTDISSKLPRSGPNKARPPDIWPLRRADAASHWEPKCPPGSTRIDCVKSKVKQVKHLRTVSKRFTDVYSISSRMAWDWCKMFCSSVVKILVKLDLDRLSQPRVIIPGHEALAPLMLVAKPLVSFKVRLPYHLPQISLLIN